MRQLELGEYLRDQGIKKVIDNNESYKERFHAAAAEILAENGTVTSLDVVDRIGMPSGHANAVGASMRSFASKNKLRVSQYIKSERPSCHAAVIAVWMPE